MRRSFGLIGAVRLHLPFWCTCSSPVPWLRGPYRLHPTAAAARPAAFCCETVDGSRAGTCPEVVFPPREAAADHGGRQGSTVWRWYRRTDRGPLYDPPCPMGTAAR